MKLYLAPESSLELTRYLRSTNGEGGLGGAPMRKRMLNDATNTVQELVELDETAQRWLAHSGDPVHVFVAARTKGTITKHLTTHVFGQPAPHGSFLDLGHGVCMCAPHFMFMQMAAQVDLVDAVRIGMELCGAYSQWRLEPGIMGDPYYREHSETQACTFELPPVMKSNRAEAFVARQSALRGSVGARTALKWVVDNSASPMETAVYLLLCLPKRLGGYGLPKPILNPKLIISTPDGTKERYPDLYWIGASIDVEYNSDLSHSGEWARYRDSKREVELTVANVRVLPLTRRQLMNASEFDTFAQGLRKMLGIRSRKADSEWAYRRDQLRSRLLSDWN